MPPDASPRASAAAPSTPIFSWQKGLDAHLAQYRSLAALATPALTPTSASPRDARTPPRVARPPPTTRTPSCAARLQCGHDRFAMVERVWDEAVPTPAPTPPPAKRRRVTRAPHSVSAPQATLDAFCVRSSSKESTMSRSDDTPSSPSSLSSCSSVPGDSDEELASPARAWLRMLGSSPTHW